MDNYFDKLSLNQKNNPGPHPIFSSQFSKIAQKMIPICILNLQFFQDTSIELNEHHKSWIGKSSTISNIHIEHLISSNHFASN